MPVEADAAWRGDEMESNPQRWLVSLTNAQLAELEAAARATLDEGVPLGDVTAESFPLPTLGEDTEKWRDMLQSGTGVVCVKSLPVRRWGVELSTYAYWGLGHHLGRPGAQNPAGDLLGHVIDERIAADSAMVRKYRTADDIAFHCDAADVVGLLCLRTAARGGQSRIASSVAAFNALLSEHPDLVAELFEPFDVDRRDEHEPHQAPTFNVTPCSWDGEVLRTFWHSDYMRSAERHATVSFTPKRRMLIDAFDRIVARSDMHLDMNLEEGDIQFISNHTVVHARTAYVDHDDPDERRHLLRLWLSLDPVESSIPTH